MKYTAHLYEILCKGLNFKELMKYIHLLIHSYWYKRTFASSLLQWAFAVGVLHKSRQSHISYERTAKFLNDTKTF